MFNTNKLTETAIITAILVVFMMMGVYVLPLVFIIYPVPFIVLGVRNGMKYSVLSIIVSTLIVGMLINIVEGVYILAISTVVALPIIYMLNKKTDTTKIIIISSVISLISAILMVFVFTQLTGVNIMSLVKAYFDEIFSVVKSMIESRDMSVTDKNQFIDILKFTIDQMMLLIPSSIIILSVFYSMVNYWLGIIVLQRLGYKCKNVPRFTHFRLPANIISGVLVMSLGILALKYFGYDYYENISINLMSIFYFLFYVQGLAVIVYLLNKTSLNTFLRRMTVFVIFITVSLSFILAIVGLLDAIFNFRKLNKYNV